MRRPAKYKKQRPPKALWLMIAVVIIATVVVVTNLVTVIVYKPEEIAQARFDEIARAYYEDYFWERITDKSALADYYKGHYVTLSTLLVYDHAKNAGLRAYFENFSCDLARTTAKITPLEPYGQKDYLIDITYSCNF